MFTELCFVFSWGEFRTFHVSSSHPYNPQVDLLLRFPKRTKRFFEVRLKFWASTLAIIQDYGNHFLFVRIFDKLTSCECIRMNLKIQLKFDREDKQLCHVAMVAKFLDLNTTVFLRIWYETTKKNIDLYDFPLHDCTQEQSGNKTGHRNTATKWPDQELDQTSHCGAHVLTESNREWGILVLVMH